MGHLITSFLPPTGGYLDCLLPELRLIPRSLSSIIVVTLFWSRVVNTLFTCIVWQKGYFHPFPLTVGILSPLILILSCCFPCSVALTCLISVYLKPVKIAIFIVQYFTRFVFSWSSFFILDSWLLKPYLDSWLSFFNLESWVSKQW